jgi:hypothetical protein
MVSLPPGGVLTGVLSSVDFLNMVENLEGKESGELFPQTCANSNRKKKS